MLILWLIFKLRMKLKSQKLFMIVWFCAILEKNRMEYIALENLFHAVYFPEVDAEKITKNVFSNLINIFSR